MVLLTEGLTRIRTLISNDIYKCQAGTGTTSPTENDTGLETPLVATLSVPTKSLATDAIQIVHTVGAGVSTGSAFAEEEIQIESGSTSLNRIVHYPLTKNALDQFEYITVVFIKSV